MNKAAHASPSARAVVLKLVSSAALATSALGAMVQVGCEHKEERPALATYPVTGKVLTSGKLPVGGCVQFQPVESGADYTANGIIDEQGRFSLRVPYVDRVLPGATAGPHTVRVLLPLKDGGAPVPIAGTFEVKTQNNEFKIEMPRTASP
jgi:hypothetical protein